MKQAVGTVGAMHVTIDDPVELAWDSIRTGLRRDCGARTFDNWLKPSRLVGYDADEATVRIALWKQAA